MLDPRNLPPHTFLGVLIISAEEGCTIPFFARSDLKSHLGNPLVGAIGIHCDHHRNFYDPAHGRSFRAYSTDSIDLRSHAETLSSGILSKENADDNLRDRFRNTVKTLDLPLSTVLAFEQESPHGFLGLYSKAPIYMTGVHSKDLIALYFTNLVDLPSHILGNFGSRYWVWRMKEPQGEFCNILFPQRILGKWNRWNAWPSQKFQALELSQEA